MLRVNSQAASRAAKSARTSSPITLALATVRAVYESARTGLPVLVDDVLPEVATPSGVAR